MAGMFRQSPRAGPDGGSQQQRGPARMPVQASRSQPALAGLHPGWHLQAGGRREAGDGLRDRVCGIALPSKPQMPGLQEKRCRPCGSASASASAWSAQDDGPLPSVTTPAAAANLPLTRAQQRRHSRGPVSQCRHMQGRQALEDQLGRLRGAQCGLQASEVAVRHCAQQRFAPVVPCASHGWEGSGRSDAACGGRLRPVIC